MIPDVERRGDAPSRRPSRRPSGSSRPCATYRRLLLTLGVAVLAIGAARAARQVVLPLWAVHIGLSPEVTSLVFGVASAVDMALFYPSGKVMDRHGRLAVAVPSMLVLGAAMAVLPLTGGLVTLTAVAMVMSFGNGIGSGIVMTLGADVAPPDNRRRFLSMWRLMSDTGNALRARGRLGRRRAVDVGGGDRRRRRRGPPRRGCGWWRGRRSTRRSRRGR